ncbi:MAG: MarR family transcriptional regulator [Candidatus Omnitrophota bacterium]
MTGISITDFSKQMHHLMPEIFRGFARLQANEVYKGKITLPQLLILEFLNKEGPQKMTVLAVFMKVTTAAMTGAIQRLVRQGYVQRDYDKSDRRIIRIELTPKGAGLVKRMGEQRTQVVNKIFSQISEDDRADYLRVMIKVGEVLKKEENR